MNVAIIGLGPRGLAAAECLIALNHTIQIQVFETDPYPGAGPNFAPTEARDCLLNIPAGRIDLPSPLGFPSFSDWTGLGDADIYPPRADIGRYLIARAGAIESHLTIEKSKISRAEKQDDQWVLYEKHGSKWGPFDHVLLTLGQPDTLPDPQLEKWQSHAAKHSLTLLNAYPTATIRKHAADWQDATVAIRGLALSTIDVIALLTLGHGGRVEDERYVRSGNEPRLIAPFSLDGLTPAPKPIAAEEQKYALTARELEQLNTALRDALPKAPSAALVRICDALAGPAKRITGEDPREWLDSECHNPGTQRSSDPVRALEEGIAMAEGRISPDTGYAVGQIWRRIQSDLRTVFADKNTREDTRKAIVDFDNGLKRYSYGPPVSNARLLHVLVREGIVRFHVVDDPNIVTQPDGWHLDETLVADVMINAVLPSPSVKQLAEPLCVDLKNRGYFLPVENSMGAAVSETSQLVGRNGPVAGLSMLGRLTEGSAIATDSLHDCFGVRTQKWAAAIVCTE